MNTIDNEKTTNLSIEQNLIKEPHGLDSIPGYVVVVFKRLKNGGRRFFKIVNQNERFKRFFPIWNSPQNYFAVAVNESILAYSFEVTVKLEDDNRQFSLIFHLRYRASNPQELAELSGTDPLRQLCRMIAHTIDRSCRWRKWEMIKDRFRELELIMLQSERSKLNRYAATLGIKILSLELDRRLPEIDKEIDKTSPLIENKKQKLRVTKETELAKGRLYDKLKDKDLKKQLDIQDEVDALRRREQNRKLNEEKIDAIRATIANVGSGTDTPSDLQEAFDAVQKILRQQDEHADEATDEKQQSRTQQIWAHDTANLIKRLIAVGADPEAAAKAREALQKIGTEFFQTAVPGLGSSSSEDSTNNQRTDTVACTVFAPPRVRRGSNILVQVFAHLEKDQVVVKRLASEFDEETRRVAFKRLNAEIERPSKLGFCISMRGVRIDEPIQELIWRGQPEVVQFGVHIPEDITENEIVGTIYVTQNTVPFGHLKFLLCIEDVDKGLTPGKQQSEILNTWKRYDYAFISYASQDRSEVLKRVQMLERLHIRYFQDLLTLEPGDRWNEEIYKNIDRSDVFFLFWSSAARDSKWVMKEVRYALKKKGADRFAAPEIVPIIIEGPPPVPAPDELRDIYFNDVFIYFIN